MISLKPKPDYLKLIYLILFSVILSNGCHENNADPDKTKPFEIIVISDTHVRIPGNLDDGDYDNQKNLTNLNLAVDLINENYSDADFVAVTGDLVGCLFSENSMDYLVGDTESPPEKFKQIFDHLNLPYYVTLGNHDYHIGYDPTTAEHIPSLNPEAVEAVWKKVLGIKPYYSFIHKGVQMIFLNSNRGQSMFIPCNGHDTETRCMGSFDPEQMDWLETCLNRPEPAIIFCHHPPVYETETTDSFSLTSILSQFMSIDIEEKFYDIAWSHQDKILAIFVGHWHIGQEYTLFDSIKVYLTGSIGDAFGSKKNISIVKIDPTLKSIKVSQPQNF